MDAYREMIRENIDYDSFMRERPYDASQLEEMLECEMTQQPINEEAVKQLAMDLASARYEAIGNQEYEAERLRRLFQKFAPIVELDAELLRASVSTIRVHGTKVKVQLKNGQIFERM